MQTTTPARIMPYQLVCMLLLCRACRLFSLAPTPSADGFADILLGVVSQLILPLLLLPGLILLERTRSRSVIDCASLLGGKIVGGAVGVCYLLLFLVELASTLAQLQLFANVHLFERAPHGVVLITAVAAGLAAAFCGLEAVARAAFPIAVAFGVGFVLIVALAMPQVDPLRITPLSGETMENWYEVLAAKSGVSLDAALFLVLLGTLESGRKRSISAVTLLTGLGAFLVLFVVYGRLGGLAGASNYPFYTVSKASGLYVFTWLFAAAVKISLYLTAVRHCLGRILPAPARTPMCWAAAAVAAVGGFLLSEQAAWLSTLLGWLETAWPLLAALLVLPGALLLVSLIRRRKLKASETPEERGKAL